jgi:hypothetical protein
VTANNGSDNNNVRKTEGDINQYSEAKHYSRSQNGLKPRTCTPLKIPGPKS